MSAPYLYSFAQNTQFGGLPSRGADMAGHMIRAYLALAKQQKRPAGVIFVNVKNAFYTVQRAFVFTRPVNSVQSFLDKTSMAGAPEPLVGDVVLALARPAADSQANIPPEVAAIMRAAHD
eukprot:13402686-Alexandrium_andersonii.AAC.1